MPTKAISDLETPQQTQHFPILEDVMAPLETSGVWLPEFNDTCTSKYMPMLSESPKGHDKVSSE